MTNTTDFTNLATEHPNYFPGQYLLEDDFKLQHQYLSDRQLYLTQSFHVSGIIEGLEVEVTQDKKKGKNQTWNGDKSSGRTNYFTRGKTLFRFQK